jgi:hypothetical protein
MCHSSGTKVGFFGGKKWPRIAIFPGKKRSENSPYFRLYVQASGFVFKLCDIAAQVMIVQKDI